LIRRADEELEDITRKFLRSIGLEFQIRPDLMTVIVKVKSIYRKFDYSRLPDHELPGAEAQWDSIRGLLLMRETVFRAMQRGDNRARMSVAHELIHFVLGHEGILNRSIEKTGVEKSVPRIRHQESEARRGGPMLLAPAHLIPEGMKAGDIAETFGLSPEAALYRQEEVERLRRRASRYERPIPPSVLEFLQEARRRGVEIPRKK
jgi:hypothetical protein